MLPIIYIMFSEKILRQFDNHDMNWCIRREIGESYEDWYVDEIIHFMFFHRWWTYPEICKEITKGKYSRRNLVLNAIYREHSCNSNYVLRTP
jgi:hypothetical protein